MGTVFTLILEITREDLPCHKHMYSSHVRWKLRKILLFVAKNLVPFLEHPVTVKLPLNKHEKDILFLSKIHVKADCNLVKLDVDFCPVSGTYV